MEFGHKFFISKWQFLIFIYTAATVFCVLEGRKSRRQLIADAVPTVYTLQERRSRRDRQVDSTMTVNVTVVLPTVDI